MTTKLRILHNNISIYESIITVSKHDNCSIYFIIDNMVCIRSDNTSDDIYTIEIPEYYINYDINTRFIDRYELIELFSDDVLFEDNIWAWPIEEEDAGRWYPYMAGYICIDNMNFDTFICILKEDILYECDTSDVIYMGNRYSDGDYFVAFDCICMSVKEIDPPLR